MEIQSLFDSVPQENKYRLDKPLDFDHNGVPEDLGRIASSIDQWEGRVADELKLTNAEVAAIKAQYPGQLGLQTRAALHKWQEKFGLEATYRNLITVFVNADKGNYADTVCNILRMSTRLNDFDQRDQGPVHNQDTVSVEANRRIQGYTPLGLSCDPLRTQNPFGNQGYRLYQSQHPSSAEGGVSYQPQNYVSSERVSLPTPYHGSSMHQFQALPHYCTKQFQYPNPNYGPNSSISSHILHQPYILPGSSLYYHPRDHQVGHQIQTSPHRQLVSVSQDYPGQAYQNSLIYQRTEYDAHKVASSPAVSRYATYLRGVYSRAKVSSDKFPQVSCKRFINLALVKKEEISRSEADEFTKATLHGHIDEILKKKQPIKMEDILKPTEDQQSTRCVFIEGAPGIGKSTFCWEFCRRWDENQSLNTFKLVCLLRLRENRLQKARSVQDLFYHDDSDLCHNVAREIMKNEGKGVLLVLDGFDELPIHLRRTSLFVRLIQGSCLSHCTVIVTSRPSATADLLSVARPQIDKHVELLGFTQKHIEEYAKSVFPAQAAILVDFLKYISFNPAIRSMMYIPLNSAIVVEIYRANKITGSPIPQTMTQLYLELSNVLLKRHLIDRGDPLAEDLAEILEHPSPQNELYKPLCTLAELAFEGIVRQEVIFNKLPDECDHFGFMNATTELYLGSKGKASYSFLHLTLQEFLAAFHISQLSANDQKQLFEEYSENTHFDIVWRFTAGLTGFTGIECAWDAFRDNEGNMHSLYIRCLYEAQEKVDYNSVLPESKVVSYICGNEMKLFDYYALGYCVSASQCMWTLTVFPTEFGGDVFEMLLYSLQGRPSDNLKYSLSIDECSSRYDPTFLDGLVKFIPKAAGLTKFHISFEDISNGQILVHLFCALSQLMYLDVLSVFVSDDDSSTISCGDMVALSQLIQNSKFLSKFKFSAGIAMSFECLQLFSKAVFSPSSLNEVDIEVQWKKWGWTSGITPFALLEENHNIKQLILHRMYNYSNPYHFRQISHFPNASQRNKTISVQHFEDAEYTGHAMLKVLSAMIKKNHTLERLVIERCEINRVDVRTLNDALRHNNTLKELELNEVSITDYSSDLDNFNGLDSRIQDNYRIKELGLLANQ